MDQLEKLNSRKQEIEEIIKARRERLMDSYMEVSSDLSAYDQHPADMGSEWFEREKDQGILELMEFELEKVNEALDKYRQGKYGICESCGGIIEPERLERLVNTTICARCARSRQG